MNCKKALVVKHEDKNREKLLSLEKEGIYVFHGSPDNIEVLEPRQSYIYNKETKKMEKDGRPAVFATPYADVAIFRSLTNIKGIEGEPESNFGMNGGKLYFSATKNILEAAKTKTGKVYVLNKQKFQDFEGVECRSSETNEPVEVIEVNIDDLPKNIKIIEKNKF